LGLNWLIALYKNDVNGILGDEMGLGKTLQTISFLGNKNLKHPIINIAWLNIEQSVPGPYLVVCPLTLLDNWRIEFAKFCPRFVVKLYNGNKQERESLRKEIVEYILGQPKATQKDPRLNFDVIITTYELLLKDMEFFHKFKFRYVVIDEGNALRYL
jgi:SNF2 family DNA or RNA helicase